MSRERGNDMSKIKYRKDERGFGKEVINGICALMLWALLLLAPCFFIIWVVSEIADTRIGHEIQYWLESVEPR